MTHELGVVGLGHWFSWLTAGVGEGKGLGLKKAVGTKPYSAKRELLLGFGITEANYYISDDTGKIPEQFFEGIELVHISDPNKYHASQAIESLKMGKHAIIEKTIAVSKVEFDKISSYIHDNKLEDSVYLHLHYLHKQPTRTLAEILPTLVEENGKIVYMRATFFEKENEEDARRTWLFQPENGGIFMDWVHPFEVIFYSTRCTFGKVYDIKDLLVNGNYDKANATGVEAKVAVSGASFSEDASLIVRVAKGVLDIYENKSLRIEFESGNHLLLCFPSHEMEFNNPDERGRLQLIDSDQDVLMEMKLMGPNTSEIFVKEVIDFSDGVHKGLRLDEISEIFKPQWEYQSTASSRQLISDANSVKEFLDNGVEGMKC